MHLCSSVILACEVSEGEINRPIPFTTASKRIRYLGINLRRQKSYTLKTMTLRKEIKVDSNIWRDTSCSWVGRIDIVKMTILPKAVDRYSAIPIKIPMKFFIELDQKIF